MNKSITIPKSDISKKLKLITDIMFNGLSATELTITSSLIHYSINNTLAFSLDISRQIQQDLTISPTNLSTVLFRLEKKRVIARSGKVITLNPIFNNISELEKLVITFSPIE